MESLNITSQQACVLEELNKILDHQIREQSVNLWNKASFSMKKKLHKEMKDSTKKNDMMLAKNLEK